MTPPKDAANREKHNVSLAFGAEVLSDENRLEVLDVRCDCAEERFVSYGMVDRRVWLCIFVPRGEVDRIISVRKANARDVRR